MVEIRNEGIGVGTLKFQRWVRMACMEASNISVMNRALTGFPLESVIEKVQFSRLPGSNLSLKEEVLMSSFLSGAAVRIVAWAVVISPSLIVSRLIVANPPKESSNLKSIVLQRLSSFIILVSIKLSGV